MLEIHNTYVRFAFLFSFPFCLRVGNIGIEGISHLLIMRLRRRIGFACQAARESGSKPATWSVCSMVEERYYSGKAAGVGAGL